MADAREVMNIRQASHYLGVSPDTLYKYVSEERIPAFKLGNRWKFKKSILDTWMGNQSLNSDLPRPRKLTRVSTRAYGPRNFMKITQSRRQNGRGFGAARSISQWRS